MKRYFITMLLCCSSLSVAADSSVQKLRDDLAAEKSKSGKLSRENAKLKQELESALERIQSMKDERKAEEEANHKEANDRRPKLIDVAGHKMVHVNRPKESGGIFGDGMSGGESVPWYKTDEELADADVKAIAFALRDKWLANGSLEPSAPASDKSAKTKSEPDKQFVIDMPKRVVTVAITGTDVAIAQDKPQERPASSSVAAMIADSVN